MSKEFKTYNSQMKHLRNEKNIDCCGSEDKTILIRNGYFNLINGYKKPFIISTDTDGKHTYIGKSSIKHFECVKNFDAELRIHLMKYIVQVEDEIRTVTGYKFDQINNNGKTTWYEVQSYNEKLDVQDRIKVISECFTEINRSSQPYISHYLSLHKEIPTWVFVKTLNLSTFIDFFKICKTDVKDKVCSLYGIVDEKGKPDHNLMISMMHWMRKVRNSCAHNERIYGMKRNNKRVKRVFDYFLPNKSYYVNKHSSQRIMDLIVYLRYYLPDSEYIAFIEEIERLLIKLKNDINVNVFAQIRSELGISNTDDLVLLKHTTKPIYYNRF